MEEWLTYLRTNPLPVLLSSRDQALEFFIRKDLLGEPVESTSILLSLPEPQRIIKKQLENGSWPRKGEKKHTAINYALIETWRWFRIFVEKYGFTKENPNAQRAAEFLFSCQTEAGDFRGFLANQYATYYSGAILSLLIQAGYLDDPRIQRGIEWLLSMRQDDGGWTIPILTRGFDGKTMYYLTSQYAEPIEPDRSLPFSHNWTGMALRAFAVHPVHQKSEAAQTAGTLLKSRFFQPDSYTSYQDADYWLRFDYPYWWNQLVSALDSLSRLGFSKDDDQIAGALQWLIDHQEENGLWRISYMKSSTEKIAKSTSKDKQLWISFSICRVLKKYLSG